MHPLVKHGAYTLIIAIGLVAAMWYPFLPGEYDSLAVPISLLVQAIGVAGLLFVPVGLLWLAMPRRSLTFAIVSLVIGVLLALPACMIALLSVGKSFGFILFVFLAWGFTTVLPHVRNVDKKNSQINVAPMYLLLLPAILFAAQVATAKWLAQSSRDRAIVNSQAFIADIEAYRDRWGHYPVSLLAQHKDYQPGVVGIEKYHYQQQGDSYNFFFEQPRFLLDRIGTREWVVYNPANEHRVYSHTAWLLATDRSVPFEGWYETGHTQHPGWKYFYFD